MCMLQVLENPDKYRFHLKEEVGCSPEKYAATITHPYMWGGLLRSVLFSVLVSMYLMIAVQLCKSHFPNNALKRKIRQFTLEVRRALIKCPSAGYIDAVILSDLYEVSILILALDPRKREYFSLTLGHYHHAIAIRCVTYQFLFLVIVSMLLQRTGVTM